MATSATSATPRAARPAGVRPHRAPADPHRDPIPGPRGRCRPLPGQALRRRHRGRLGRHLPRRPRPAARVVRYRGPGEEELRESEMRRTDAHLGGVRWAGSFPVQHAGPMGVHDRGLDRRVRHLARRARAQGRRRPARPGGRAVGGDAAARAGAGSAAGADADRGADRARPAHPARRRLRPSRPSTTSPSARSSAPPWSGSPSATAPPRCASR